MKINQSIGKGAKSKGDLNFSNIKQEISIKDVDDSSTVKITQELNKGKAILVIREGKINIGGETIELPHYVKKGTPESITILNGNIYINGWRYKNGLFYRNIFTRLSCWI